MRPGPLTIVGLSRGDFDHGLIISRLLPAYVDVLRELGRLGVPEVQVGGGDDDDDRITFRH